MNLLLHGNNELIILHPRHFRLCQRILPDRFLNFSECFEEWGPEFGDTGCVSGHKRTYEEMARNDNEDLARRNEKLRADLEMATALARAEQEKTKFAQK